MNAPITGARTNGGGGERRDLERQIKLLRAAVRDNSTRISKIERWAHWGGGFVSANLIVAVFNLVRGFLPDGGN